MHGSHANMPSNLTNNCRSSYQLSGRDRLFLTVDFLVAFQTELASVNAITPRTLQEREAASPSSRTANGRYNGILTAYFISFLNSLITVRTNWCYLYFLSSLHGFTKGMYDCSSGDILWSGQRRRPSVSTCIPHGKKATHYLFPIVYSE